MKFFADSERVAHISEDRLMPYEGLEKFQRYAQQWKNEKLSRVKNKKTVSTVSQKSVQYFHYP